MKRRTMFTGLGALIALAMVLAACAPAATEAPPVGETLTFVQSADAGTLDMALEESANSIAIGTHIYEGLTDFEPGSTTPIPALATSWEASDDGLEWTFHLREGVTFHDGTPFNADAVVFNFERWWDPAHPNHIPDRFIYWNYMWRDVKGGENSVLAGIEKIDDMTVKLTLSEPNASMLNTLAMENFRFASPAAVSEQGENYATAEGKPVGTGAFMFEEWAIGDHITLTRNEDYWGTKPTLQKIIFRVIPDPSAAFLALQGGEIDAISEWSSPGPDQIEAAKSDPNLQVVYNPAFNVGYLGLNQAKPWLQNMNVRLAIAHAIDKQAIIDTLYSAGDGEVASQFQPPSLWGHNATLEDYPFDLAKAMEYLQAAVDEGVQIPDPVIFYVMPTPRLYFPQPQPTGELIQSMLAELGLNTEIQSPAWPDPYLVDLQEDGTKADIFLLGWGGDNGDPDNFLCVFFCGGDTQFQNDGAGGGVPPDEEIAQLLRAAVAETDFAARETMYQQINQLLHDRVVSVPIVHRRAPTLMRANIGGYVPSPVREVLTYLTKE